ncbi:CDK-activating kinase assembly factor MAT1-domain-containing protein [Elsinoe ampelina]|uniref:RNA polymerase II transcription factor B subunit 3 n=1 Tax=Elsinoe ampelina TaxID=302913 RepID=A0A6A6GDI2_9PEZI|nr:CDK-activating kinase assembly factor MAT1-domain-containing protein [Elsinoe ampelina]
MSRLAQGRSGAGAGRPGEQDEICPVCKSSRYLNKSMRFLVNPECYHKMCESCVDRIFSHGPNKCPIAGCTRTLRKHRFREQTFEDIQVEREVDIRKRIAAVFNRREEEFDTLLDYNNYLNDVEDITYNLINKIDVEETEKKLQAYSAQNKEAIASNAAAESQLSQDLSALQAAEREQARLRREALRREEEQERRDKREGRTRAINRLASGADAKELEEENRIATLKRDQVERLKANGNGFVVKGLKQKKAPEPEKPFDAFGGFSLNPQYYAVQERYEWPWLNNVREDPVINAGGYDIQEFHTRALVEAFAGLGVFIGTEKNNASMTSDTLGPKAVGTAGAAEVGAKDMKMDDPF